MARIDTWVVLGALSLAACGDRTDLILDYGVGSGTGGYGTGTGGYGTGTGGYGAGGRGTGGYTGSGGYGTGGTWGSGATWGTGGPWGPGGYTGAGGYPVGGYAGVPIGGYAGYGGYPVTGGFGGYGASCGNCPSIPDPTTGQYLPTCCSLSGNCGVESTSFLYATQILPLCVEPAPAGYYDPTCPSLSTATGYFFNGCCGFDGLCGIDFGQYGIGCQSDAQFGIFVKCGLPPPPPPLGTGGAILK